MLNKAQIIGRLGNDPDLKYLPSGDAVTNLSVATSDRWKDKQTGEQKEKTEWHRVTMFKRLAEIAGEHLRKGSLVYIEGSLQTREWEKDGVKRYSTEIVAREMKMLGSKNDNAGRNAGDHASVRDAGDTAPNMRSEQRPAAEEFDDDIPF